MYRVYCTLKSITGIALVIGLILVFGSLLSKESIKLENITKTLKSKFK